MSDELDTIARRAVQTAVEAVADRIAALEETVAVLNTTVAALNHENLRLSAGHIRVREVLAGPVGERRDLPYAEARALSDAMLGYINPEVPA